MIVRSATAFAPCPTCFATVGYAFTESGASCLACHAINGQPRAPAPRPAEPIVHVAPQAPRRIPCP